MSKVNSTYGFFSAYMTKVVKGGERGPIYKPLKARTDYTRYSLRSISSGWNHLSCFCATNY